MRRRFFLFVLAAIVLQGSPASAKPNFTGSWKLIVEKSDFGPMPPPDKIETKVAHSDPELRAATTQSSQAGEVSTDWTLNTEGKETSNSFMGNPAKSTAKWDGDTLVVETKLNIQGTDITQIDRWTLADEGKTLKMQTSIKTPQGDLDLSMTFGKQ